MNSKVREEFRGVIAMHHTTTGGDIFDFLMKILNEYNLHLKRLFCIKVDGALIMTVVPK